MTSERINLYTVALVFLPGSIDVVLLRLFSLEDLFHGRLNLININLSSVSGMLDDVRWSHILLVGSLLRDKVARGRLLLLLDLLREQQMRVGLPVGFESETVERVAQLANDAGQTITLSGHLAHPGTQHTRSRLFLTLFLPASQAVSHSPLQLKL